MYKRQVLAGVAEIGDNSGDAAGGGPLQGIDHDEQFHQGIVDGAGLSLIDKGAGGLDHENVGAADSLIDGGKIFSIGEGSYLGAPEGDAQLLTDVLGQLGVGIAGKDLDKMCIRDSLYSNPNNPTGVIYSPEEVAAIGRLAKKYNVAVIADELYSRQLFDKDQPYTHLRLSLIHI